MRSRLASLAVADLASWWSTVAVLLLWLGLILGGYVRLQHGLAARLGF